MSSGRRGSTQGNFRGSGTRNFRGHPKFQFHLTSTQLSGFARANDIGYIMTSINNTHSNAYKSQIIKTRQQPYNQNQSLRFAYSKKNETQAPPAPSASHHTTNDDRQSSSETATSRNQTIEQNSQLSAPQFIPPLSPSFGNPSSYPMLQNKESLQNTSQNGPTVEEIRADQIAVAAKKKQQREVTNARLVK